jgi:hypothetical protein
MPIGKRLLRLASFIISSGIVVGCQNPGAVGVKPDDGGPPPSPDGLVVVIPEAGTTTPPDGGCLQPTSCTTATGKYCGLIADGCGGNVNCGTCPTNQVCANGVCTSGSIYDGGVFTSCTPPGGQYCGDIGNGAGGKLACGACPGDWLCTDGLCTGNPATCVSRACVTPSGNYCGVIGDDCGHAKDCGACPAGQACVNSLCVPATNCVPQTCNPTGGQYCGGVLGDGCGGSITCGDCTTPGWGCVDNLCKGGPTCTKLACGAGKGKYCGTVGDGCGGSVACGDCIAGETCQNNICVPTVCTPLTCNPTGGQYCGVVGNGCGGTLACSQPCPAGWSCVGGLCVGGATCDRLTSCSTGTPFNYCGSVGDRCGGTLACGNDCAAGQVCDTTTGLCKGDATCVPKTCTNSTLFNYCGEVGDGCGGTLSCGDDCAARQTCEKSVGLCKGDATCVPVTCDNGTEFNYCGDSGDGCGGSLHCGDDCAAGQVCGTDGVCKGDPTCVPKTCDNGTPFPYCGNIGDGCGGRLTCSKNCGTGRECGIDGLCKGDATCVPTSCDNGTDFKYCGRVGDGCGGALVCSTNCGTGKTCDTSTGLCKGDATCVPRASCTNSTPFNYCGTIGDGCGGSLLCSTSCGAGKVCDTTAGLCKGDATCEKIQCQAANGGQYCGGPIGDGCGGSLTCTAPCPTGTKCTGNVCVCDGSLICQVAKCDAGSTTITGKVYDPAGKNAVYNVMVYVPNSPLTAVTHGVSCDQCGTPSGDPITAALTGTDGSFTLTNAPNGTNIPLVMQIGKWRRQIKIPTVNPCATTDLSSWVDSGGVPMTRLPRNQTDGDTGTVSLPKIALAAGAYDRLQCLLTRMGLATTEFTSPGGTGSVSMYLQSRNPGRCTGFDGTSGNYPDASNNLWDSQTHLNQYDMILLNCGGNMNAVDPTHRNYDANFINHPDDVNRMKAYVDAGGRVFTEHYHWTWIRAYSSSYPSVFGDVATWTAQTGNTIGNSPRDTLIDQSFPKGIAFAQWLLNVQASTTLGHLTLTSQAKPTAIDQINPPSRRWIYEPASSSDPTGAAQYTHYLSFNAPVTAAASAQCGRFVYTGLHVTDTASDPGNNDPNGSGTLAPTTFPACCAAGDLTPQEKALEFMILDLSSCISDQTLPPPIIPTSPPPAAPPPPPPPASPPPPPVPVVPPPPPAPAPPTPPPPATVPPPPPTPPVPAPPAPPPPVAAPPPPPPPPPAQTPPPPPPPPQQPPPFIP